MAQKRHATAKRIQIDSNWFYEYAAIDKPELSAKSSISVFSSLGLQSQLI